MAEFKYITKLNQHPQGKQRVYFTCHPQDFKSTFEEIKKDILDRQEVAIFYLEPDTRSEEVDDYELQLGEMQLFVVPVTTKLLTTPNRVIDVEVPFAQEHHIPILPLMRESRLDELFNEKFGDLQYLDKFNTDPTAIAFDEKLTKYLESIIVGDELARQVRDAFDAYIFLSYRKKDRKYAQELMKLIHENDFARDIAIWYDEFLTPGEDFNNAIKSALEKSDLFALTVTPSLLEMPGGKPNFVMDKEFPAARDSGKPILPAEMLATNRNELNDKYNDIPEPVGEGDKKALSERLLALLKKIAIAENDKEPQHNYFIGLAYLSGIDVEVDYNKAEKLITGAAVQNFIPAVKKLVDMYNTGKGVVRDYHKAVEWQEKLIELYDEQYQKNPTKQDAVNLSEALLDCCNSYYELRMLTKAEEKFHSTLDYMESFIKIFSDEIFKRMSARCYHTLYDIALKSYSSSFLEYRQKEIEMLDGLFRDKEILIKELKDPEKRSSAVEMLRDISKYEEIVGEMEKSNSCFVDAEICFRQKRKVCKALVETTGSFEDIKDLCDCYNKLGDVARKKNDLFKTRDYYREGLEVRERLAQEIKTFGFLRDLSVNYYRLGYIENLLGNSTESEKYYLKALDIRLKLVSETENIQSYEDLAISYYQLGDLLSDSEYLRKSADIWASLIEKCPDVLWYRQYQSDVQKKLRSHARSEYKKGKQKRSFFDRFKKKK